MTLDKRGVKDGDRKEEKLEQAHAELTEIVVLLRAKLSGCTPCAVSGGLVVIGGIIAVCSEFKHIDLQLSTTSISGIVAVILGALAVYVALCRSQNIKHDIVLVKQLKEKLLKYPAAINNEGLNVQLSLGLGLLREEVEKFLVHGHISKLTPLPRLVREAGSESQ